MITYLYLCILLRTWKITSIDSGDTVRCVLNIPANSTYRITSLNLGTSGFQPSNFISVNGKKPFFQPKTQFGLADNYTRHFLWLNESLLRENRIDTNIVEFNQYQNSINGTAIIIDSSSAQLQLDFRKVVIPGLTSLLRIGINLCV